MELHVRTAGSGDAGTIVFVHGFPLDGSVWDPQMAALPDGWRGIAPDLRGFGRTPLGAGELPAGSEAPGVIAAPDAVARPDEAVLTMEAMADDVARIIERDGGGPVVVCGLSMGGYVTFALHRRHPDLVRGLVLMDTRATADTTAGREKRRRMADTARRTGAGPIAAAMLPGLLTERTREARPNVAEHVRAMIERTAPRTIIAALAGMATRRDASPDLPDVAVPALVIVGAEDTITPPDDARAMAAALPDARLEIIDGTGHLAGLEEPAIVNRLVVDFLTTL